MLHILTQSGLAIVPLTVEARIRFDYGVGRDKYLLVIQHSVDNEVFDELGRYSSPERVAMEIRSIYNAMIRGEKFYEVTEE